MNGTLFQAFHWYTSDDGTLWRFIKQEAGKLADWGITAVWLPPACKCKDGIHSHGYDIYDLFDLGEFDQKGSVRTRYGTRDEYIACIDELHKHNIKVYIDAVLNQKDGADETEKVTVRRVNPENRNEFISEPFEIEAYTKFTFPGRQGKYSKFIWDHHCFTGVDFAQDLGESGIFTIQNEYGEGWEEMADDEKGNFDYLLGADIEYRNEAVREEVKYWGKWYLETAKFDGVRLDAIKHMPPRWIKEWVEYLRSLNPDLFAVGEYWSPDDLDVLLKYIEFTGGQITLMDAPLHGNLHRASKEQRDYNLAAIFDGSLVKQAPQLAVTVVDNHDTQPLQSLEAPVEPWFKPLAYALILLRQDGYPCVFFPDIYGAKYTDKGKDGNDHEIYLPGVEGMEQLLKARKNFAYGMQRDYFDHSNCIGWTREGIAEVENSGCAVVLSNGDDGTKTMEMGKQHAGKKFIDFTGHVQDEITIDENGWAEFRVKGSSVSVWINKI